MSGGIRSLDAALHQAEEAHRLDTNTQRESGKKRLAHVGAHGCVNKWESRTDVWIAKWELTPPRGGRRPRQGPDHTSKGAL